MCPGHQPYRLTRLTVDRVISMEGEWELILIYLAQVLKDQVVDTVYLLHMPRKGMISLRFLACYFLGKSLYSFTTVLVI
jgi:hypothetical protein